MANMDENQTSTVTVGWSLVISLMRFLTFIFLLVSLIVLATDTVESVISLVFQSRPLISMLIGKLAFSFQILQSCFYFISAIAIGMAYTLLLAVLTILHAVCETPIGVRGFAYFEFYSEKVTSYLLATGAAAGLGFSAECSNKNLGIDFFNVANAAASLLLLGSFFPALSSILSSLNLTKSFKF
ncbi:CASP-like protein PIMP1 [Nicotiana tabacum]|uniref:CASP-like protein PIMP1 n=1 Tax=Nicotiana tabacum TaxID=4097 RepID=A0AC58S6L0_TOBAC